MNRTLRLLSLVVLIAGCSSLEFPGTYRIDIHQGNIISQVMVDKLKVGMTRRQVQYLLGTPLIRDSFSRDRWEYYYSARDSKGETVQKRVIVLFVDDSLYQVAGDYAPPTLDKTD